MIFGSMEPLESYCAHLLLSKDEIYFTVLETKGFRSIYGPRSTVQVNVLHFVIIFCSFLTSVNKKLPNFVPPGHTFLLALV